MKGVSFLIDILCVHDLLGFELLLTRKALLNLVVHELGLVVHFLLDMGVGKWVCFGDEFFAIYLFR